MSLRILRSLAPAMVLFLHTHWLLAQPHSGSSADINRGRLLYGQNCFSCHAIHKELIGPAFSEKEMIALDKNGPGWVIKWIQNSQSLVQNHDTAAVRIFNQYNKTVMPAFTSLSKADIQDIGMYIMSESHRLDSLAAVRTAVSTTQGNQSSGSFFTPIVAFIVGMASLGALLFIFVFFEFVVITVGREKVQELKPKQQSE